MKKIKLSLITALLLLSKWAWAQGNESVLVAQTYQTMGKSQQKMALIWLNTERGKGVCKDFLYPRLSISQDVQLAKDDLSLSLPILQAQLNQLLTNRKQGQLKLNDQSLLQLMIAQYNILIKGAETVKLGTKANLLGCGKGDDLIPDSISVIK